LIVPNRTINALFLANMGEIDMTFGNRQVQNESALPGD
jgi:hypothetical protein